MSTCEVHNVCIPANCIPAYLLIYTPALRIEQYWKHDLNSTSYVADAFAVMKNRTDEGDGRNGNEAAMQSAKDALDRRTLGNVADGRRQYGSLVRLNHQ